MTMYCINGRVGTHYHVSVVVQVYLYIQQCSCTIVYTHVIIIHQQQCSLNALFLSRLTTLVFDIIHYCLEHNAESEACDLLMEVDEIEKIEQFVTEEAHDRVCLYLIRYLLCLRVFESLLLLSSSYAFSISSCHKQCFRLLLLYIN